MHEDYHCIIHLEQILKIKDVTIFIKIHSIIKSSSGCFTFAFKFAVFGIELYKNEKTLLISSLIFLW